MREKVLFILTSHGKLGDTGNDTGFFWEEMATPYWSLTDAGYDVVLASVEGGKPPADPRSAEGDAVNDDVRRFWDDQAAMHKLENTAPVDEVSPADFAGVYFPGGHGTMWDLAQTEAVGRTVAAIWNAGGVVGAVCHGPAGLTEVYLPDGKPLVAGRKVAGFTNAEEEEAGLTDVVPYLLEDRLNERGADHQPGPKFEPQTVRDGRLVTGQNQQSSEAIGQLLVEALQDREKAAA